MAETNSAESMRGSVSTLLYCTQQEGVGSRLKRDAGISVKRRKGGTPAFRPGLE